LRETAKEINKIICDNLPTDECSIGPIISYAVDTLNHHPLDTTTDNHYNYGHYTNLPDELILKEGARVMFLNNKLFDHNICNGTVGKETIYFDINGNPASRHQFPLQNAFALTIHKIQGLILPHMTINVDQKIFAEGQVYVAMSRAPT
ncbi:6129_t:CDS:2, partial [Ambispora leptoticha]